MHGCLGKKDTDECKQHMAMKEWEAAVDKAVSVAKKGNTLVNMAKIYQQLLDEIDSKKDKYDNSCSQERKDLCREVRDNMFYPPFTKFKCIRLILITACIGLFIWHSHSLVHSILNPFDSPILFTWLSYLTSFKYVRNPVTLSWAFVLCFDTINIIPIIFDLLDRTRIKKKLLHVIVSEL